MADSASTEGVWKSGWSPEPSLAAVGTMGEAKVWPALGGDVWGGTRAKWCPAF